MIRNLIRKYEEMADTDDLGEEEGSVQKDSNFVFSEFMLDEFS